MSVSSLPEWKQLLLERKRREEEERERKEKQEEEKFASMPAWKRGIIQRRKAKQDSLGDREKERDVCPLHMDVRSPSDGLSDTDSSLTLNLGSELSASPDPGHWLDADVKPVSKVSVVVSETIVPLHENPFILTQSSRRRGRDADLGSETEVKEKEKLSPRSQDGESGKGRDVELKIERFRDLSEGRQKEKGRERSQGQDRESSRGRKENDKNQWKESKDAAREREFLKMRRDEEDKESDLPCSSFSPLMPCLRTIRADNIIIIEQDRKGPEERKGRWLETGEEGPEDDQQGKRGVKMDLREILAVGGSVTEIRASEVLIIKPSESTEERNAKGGVGGKGLGKEDGEMKGSVDGRWDSIGRELRTDMSWFRGKEKERPWGQATVIKDDRKESLDDNVFVDRGGRVSQLLSKFGERPKPPSRSKSSDNFLRPVVRKYSDEEGHQSEADGRNMLLKAVPKRSFSFSDRVISSKENGLDDDGCQEKRMRARIHSDKSVPPWVNISSSRKEGMSKIKLGCARLLDKDRLGRYRERYLKNGDQTGGPMHRRTEAEVKKVEPLGTKAPEKSGNVDGDEGFTVASVKNPEEILFARRVPIRQDGRKRAEREAKRAADEKSLERKLSVERDSEVGGLIQEQVFDKKLSDYWRQEGLESTVSPDALQESYALAASGELASSGPAAETQYGHESAFTDCSSLICSQDPHRGPEWSTAAPQRPYSVLSQQTEELLSKIEKLGDMSIYNNEKGERLFKGGYEVTKESKQEVQMYNEAESENLIHDLAPRSPKRIVPLRIPPCPLEIQIPRTVFYVAEDMMEKKKAIGQSIEAQDHEEGKGVERRDSWRIGKPLSRIESLREKIRQKEMDDLKQTETQDEGGSEDAEINVEQEERPYERGTEIEKEWGTAVHMRNRSVEAERGQEDTAEQTSITAFDVTEEVSVLKTCPQLPVSVPHTQADRGEEVTTEYTTAASDNLQISENEDYPEKHVEEQLRHHRGQDENREEREETEKELSEEESEENTSPPHPSSLAAMSRIYNLETVSSRSGLCLRERSADIPSLHLVKMKPIIQNAKQGDSKAFSSEDICGVQTIQRQMGQFQLKEQEVVRSCTSPGIALKGTETQGQQGTKGSLKHQEKDDTKSHEKDQETAKPKVTAECAHSPTPPRQQLNQTVTLTPPLPRSRSLEDNLNRSDCSPTPASSPRSPSPAQSPSISPCPTPSPPLFSIRSASGGKVKRGATITIIPRKLPGGGGKAATGSTTASSTTAKTQQNQATSAEQGKKKYPTAEEIEVIGGYQNLEKSCLVKNRPTPKKGKVCFDEDQLEQVCEYPSETSMLAYSPYPQDQWKVQGEEVHEQDAEAESGTIPSKSTKNVGTSVGRCLRVDESCPR